jgi:hypothetical protein
MCKRTSRVQVQVEQYLAAFCRAEYCSSSLLDRLPLASCLTQTVAWTTRARSRSEHRSAVWN